jgi:hypothetical protein
MCESALKEVTSRSTVFTLNDGTTPQNKPTKDNTLPPTSHIYPLLQYTHSISTLIGVICPQNIIRIHPAVVLRLLTITPLANLQHALIYALPFSV